MNQPVEDAIGHSARKWSRWKAQQSYRATRSGQEKRNGQSRRYRERVRRRKPPEPEAVSEVARVITKEDFFRAWLRPARLLREIRAPAAKSLATLLLAGVPARHGARLGAGAALAAGARFNPDILIYRRHWPTFSLSDATGVSPARPRWEHLHEWTPWDRPTPGRIPTAWHRAFDGLAR